MILSHVLLGAGGALKGTANGADGMGGRGFDMAADGGINYKRLKEEEEEKRPRYDAKGGPRMQRSIQAVAPMQRGGA